MNAFKTSFVIVYALMIPACQTNVPAPEAKWTMNKNEWVSHRFADIALKSPAQLPVAEIGNGTWYLLVKWTPKYPTEKIVVHCSRIRNQEPNALFESSKRRIMNNGGLILPWSTTNAYLFSWPSGYSTKGTTLPGIKPFSDVDYSDYGVSMLLDRDVTCSIVLSKRHDKVIFMDWKCNEIFSAEEMQLVKEIAKTTRIVNMP